jgi:hypothetical protein
MSAYKWTSATTVILDDKTVRFGSFENTRNLLDKLAYGKRFSSPGVRASLIPLSFVASILLSSSTLNSGGLYRKKALHTYLWHHRV